MDDIVERHEAGAPWRDHMIIARSAWASRSVEAEMAGRNVPYVFIGGTRLFSAAHVKDLLCMVRAAGSRRDGLAWLRYLTLWPRVGDVSASRVIEALNEGLELEQALRRLRTDDDARDRIAGGVRLVEENWATPSRAVGAAAEFLAPLLERRYPRWQARKRDVDLLVGLAGRFGNTLSFLETYALDPVYTTEVRRREGDDAVTLVTAHSAKGTEAPVCYLVRVEPGFYPHSRSIGNPDDEEEERRVLYVAMTRAADELVITRSRTSGWRTADGGSSASGRLYFLRDLPGRLVETEHAGFFGGLQDATAPITPWKDSGRRPGRPPEDSEGTPWHARGE